MSLPEKFQVTYFTPSMTEQVFLVKPLPRAAFPPSKSATTKKQACLPRLRAVRRATAATAKPTLPGCALSTMLGKWAFRCRRLGSF